MSEEFKPITIETQEQMDNLFKDRLNRQAEKHKQEIEDIKASYSDYADLKKNAETYSAEITGLKAKLDEANQKVSGFDSIIAEKDKIIKGYEVEALKTKIIGEMGMSVDAMKFLSGNDEESIKASAESLKTLIGKTHSAPMASNEPSGGADTIRASYAQLANSLK